MDQRGSIAFSMSSSACRRPDSWLMRRASCVRRHALSPLSVPRIQRPTLQAHASCVRLMRHGSCVMRQASCVRLMAHASGVRRPTCPIQPIQPPPVAGHDDNKAAAFFPYATHTDLRPLSYMAWGNRVVLPTPYNSMGAIVRIRTGRGTQRSAAACCYSYEKGRHCAGLFMVIKIPSQ